MHQGYRGMKDSDNQLQNCWDTPAKKWPFLLQIAPGHRSVRYNTDLPPIQSCSSKFWAWFCIASNFDNGWRGDHNHKIMDRSFMPKYGSVSSTFATCSIFSLTVKTHIVVLWFAVYSVRILVRRRHHECFRARVSSVGSRPILCNALFIRASAEDSRSFVMVAAHVLEICSNLYKSGKN